MHRKEHLPPSQVHENLEQMQEQIYKSMAESMVKHVVEYIDDEEYEERFFKEASVA